MLYLSGLRVVYELHRQQIEEIFLVASEVCNKVFKHLSNCRILNW